MVWKRLFRQNDPQQAESDTQGEGAPPPDPVGTAPEHQAVQPPIPGAHLPGGGSGGGIGGRAGASGSAPLPPHMQRVVQERRRPAGAPPTGDPRQRLARLQQQRMAILFDVDQGQLAEDDENPWTHRIALLTEAMETVTVDLATLAAAPPVPSWPVPPVPVADLAASDVQPFALSLRIGDEMFAWEEALDWAERGHQISLPELNRTQGRIAAIVPSSAPDALRDALGAHLSQSLDSFAEDLRERRLNGDELPADTTLTDLARPSPDVGGWLDWHGRSPVRAVRAAEELRLRRERDRLLSERGREAEERHRLVERLPIARRRLADVDAEIAATEAVIAGGSTPTSSR